MTNDPARPNRLVFVEHWASADDLFRHFKVPASAAFARAMATLGITPPEMGIFDARAMPLPGALPKAEGGR